MFQICGSGDRSAVGLDVGRVVPGETIVFIAGKHTPVTSTDSVFMIIRVHTTPRQHVRGGGGKPCAIAHVWCGCRVIPVAHNRHTFPNTRAIERLHS